MCDKNFCFRKIWCLLCINSFANICCHILCAICHCWWVSFCMQCIFWTSSLVFKEADIDFLSTYFTTAAVGISFIQFANPNSMRNIYVLGLSLFLGISIPQYFIMNTDVTGHGPVKTGGGWVRKFLIFAFGLILWSISLSSICHEWLRVSVILDIIDNLWVGLSRW